jgi:phospholipid/cholesterol/gamma-HCH transport system substrate-binding protein
VKVIVLKNYKPFLAVLALAAIGIGVGLYILTNQGLRIPFIHPTPIKMNVEMETAQAVTPGQGQTVQVGGVQIGDITSVELKEGRAIIGVDIEPEFDDLIHRDATALLRPRTGLKDMYIQVFPGKEGEPVGEGHTIPLRNTATDVDLDEILATLDERTRDYLTLLVDGTGKGLDGRGAELREVFDRFGPTMRDLGRVNRAVATERVALRRLITSLAELNAELAKNPEDLTQLVDSAATTFGAFASEDQNLRATVSELPDTLRRATVTLEKVRPFARELGPATRALAPAIEALDRANAQLRPFAREAEPIVRTQIRPFVREARPVVASLAPAARDLSRSFPPLVRSTKVLNQFFNMLAFNPGGREGPERPGREEGYLFWLAWASHQGINLQNIEDANGPMRPLFLTGTCATLTSLVQDEPILEFSLNLSPILATFCGNPATPSIDLAAIQQLLGQLPTAPVTDPVTGALPTRSQLRKAGE